MSKYDESKLKEWMGDSPVRTIAVGSSLFAVWIFVLAMLPWIAHTYLGAVPFIMAMSVDAGLVIAAWWFCLHIGMFD